MKNPVTFEGMKFHDLRPWRHLNTFPQEPWGYHPYFTKPEPNTLFESDAVREWDLLMDNWMDVCFNSDHFEIVVTLDMGLGIRSTRESSFSDISEDLFGFLEIIQFGTFTTLFNRQYPSLYEFEDDQDDLQFAVLYGPLSLCNSQADNSVGFEHFHINGMDLLTRVSFRFGVIIEEFDESEDIMEITQNVHSLEFDVKYYNAVTESHIPFHTTDRSIAGQIDMSNELMVKWFHRVRIALRPSQDEHDTFYLPGQDVCVYYRLNDSN